MVDDDEKFRRNLVVFSSLIILSSWLEYPDLSILSKFFEIDSKNPSPWRVTTAALFVLIYLASRYRFSTASQTAVIDLKLEYADILAKKERDSVIRGLHAFNGSKMQNSIFLTNLLDYIKDDTEGHSSDSTQLRWEITSSSLNRTSYLGGVAHAKRTYFNADGKFLLTSEGGLGIEYLITGVRKFLVQIIAAMQITTYSKSSLEFITPITLGCIASVVLVIRLIKQIFVLM